MSESELPISEDETPTAADPAQIRPFVLSITGLLLGLVALALVTIPALALDRPVRNPVGAEPDPQAPPQPAEPEGGLTLKYKDFSFNIGGKKEEQAAELPPPQQSAAEVTSDPIRWFTIAAIGFALTGIVFSAIGQIKEQHTTLTVSAMSCCVAAMTWQYLAAGIMIGAGVAVFLIVIAALASAAG